jgi:hypothetical protein
MKRALIVLALWAVSPAPGQVGSVALYTGYQQQPPPAIVRALREEVEFLLAPQGLRFEWRSLPADGPHVSVELAVVNFKGRCEVLPSAINSHLDQRLGWSYISDGEVLPFADVDCDAIRAYLLKSLFTLPPQSRENALGRAIGRVMAHELLHVFARTAHHSSHGVDQPAFTTAELLADRLVFDEREPDLHMLRLSPAATPRQPLGSPPAGRTAYLRAGCNICHGAQAEGTRRGPVLRVSGRFLNSVMLAAKLAKSENKMHRRAQSLKVTTPSLSEEDLPDMVSFLNSVHQ